MLGLVLLYVLIASISGLAGVVGAYAWDYRPARIFVITCITLLLVLLFAHLRTMTSDQNIALILSSLNLAGISLLNLMILLLLSAMFTPIWYQGRLPIVWIALPYLLASLLLLLDGLLDSKLIVSGLRMSEQGFRPEFTDPGVSIMLGLFVFSWIPHLAVLGVAFAQQPLARKSISLLIIILIGSVLSSSFGAGGIIQSLIIVGAFAYIVLRTRLLLPTRAGLAMAVYAMEDALIIRDRQASLTFSNPAAERLGLHSAEALAALGTSTAEQYVHVAGRTLVLRQQPLFAPSGKPMGTLLLARDVTALKQREQQLEAEQARLIEIIDQLNEAQQARAHLAQTVQQLTMPVIPVLPGVRIIPLVGFFDGPRSAQLNTTMLEHIERSKARILVLDFTGALLFDTAGAQGLLGAMRAIKLLGARCILVGIHPELAQTLVGLNLVAEALDTTATLEQAVQIVIAQYSGQSRQPPRLAI